MLEKLHIFICVFAALVVTVFGIIQNIGFYDLCVRLVITIIVFYFLGIAARVYLKNKVFNEKVSDTDEHDSTSHEELQPEEADIQQ